MNPFVSTQVQAVIEGIRLLEAFVTAPLGLHSDIKMLRESLSLPEAAELSRDEQRERRIAYGAFAQEPMKLVLDAMSYVNDSLDILAQLKDVDRPFDSDWITRTRRVIARAEQQVSGDLRAIEAKKIEGIYVIVDPEATKGRPVLEVAEASLKGGAKVIQLRDKLNDKGDILPVARELTAMCDAHDALFFMNDDVDLAVASGAHGLHIGQADMPVAEARSMLAPLQLIGRSNGGVEEAVESQAQGADYLAVGAVYATTTMDKSGRTALGPETVGKVKEFVSKPIVAIGGINIGNIVDVASAGADCLCVVSAVTFADDPEAATRELVEAIQSIK